MDNTANSPDYHETSIQRVIWQLLDSLYLVTDDDGASW